MQAPRIWTRRPKILEPRDPLVLGSRMAGYVRLQTIRPDGRVHRDTGFFPNLITDSGLNLVATDAGLGTYVVGTSNTAPAVGQTDLIAQVASTSTAQSLATDANIGAEQYCETVQTLRFSAPGSAHNLAEVGVKEGSTLFSRALILDGGGSPTTFAWAADEALDMTYQLRIYPPLDDVDTTMVVEGVTYDIRIRACNVDAWACRSYGLGSKIAVKGGAGFSDGAVYNGSIGSITGVPSGTSAGAGDSYNQSYSADTFYLDFVQTFGLGDGNVGGITAIRLDVANESNAGSPAGGQPYQVGILSGGTGAIPKTGSEQMTLNWRHTWARRSI